MSVRKRQLKTADELQAWLAERAKYFPREWEKTGDFEIVHQSPRTGSANWKAVDRGAHGRLRDSAVVRSLIATAQMQFDLR
jgi:hypothetical protein